MGSGMSRQSWLVVLVAILTITCLGLIIGLATLGNSEQLQQPQKSQAAEPEPEAEPEAEPVFTEPWEKDVRLPSHLLPLHYDLYLHPDLDTGLFMGRVAIAIEATSPTSYFLVHTKYLDISDTRLANEDGDEISYMRAFEYERNEFWVVQLARRVSLMSRYFVCTRK